MPVRIGLDVGSATVKLAAILTSDVPEELARVLNLLPGSRFFAACRGVSVDAEDGFIIVNEYCRPSVDSLTAALDLLQEFHTFLPDSCTALIRVTGSAGRRVAEALNVAYENEFKAIARGISVVAPGGRTVFEMGAENSKYLLLDVVPDQKKERDAEAVGILDFSTSAQCAAARGRSSISKLRACNIGWRT